MTRHVTRNVMHRDMCHVMLIKYKNCTNGKEDDLYGRRHKRKTTGQSVSAQLSRTNYPTPNITYYLSHTYHPIPIIPYPLSHTNYPIPIIHYTLSYTL